MELQQKNQWDCGIIVDKADCRGQDEEIIFRQNTST